jgi:hypothetical protein
VNTHHYHHHQQQHHLQHGLAWMPSDGVVVVRFVGLTSSSSSTTGIQAF